MVDQITVFLENKEGHLAELVRTVSSSGANMSALTVADTSSYGVVRILCSDTAAAVKALEAAGYRAALTKVVAVRVENEPGSLVDLLAALDDAGINIEYTYCFAQADTAVNVLKVRNANEAVAALKEAGFRALEQYEL
jgi:hypothetical protein